MRRHRARRALGIRIVPVRVSIDAVQALIEGGLVESADDIEAIAEAFSELIEDQVNTFSRYA